MERRERRERESREGSAQLRPEDRGRRNTDNGERRVRAKQVRRHEAQRKHRRKHWT